MKIDCSLDWSGLSPDTGPCIRPGGTALTQRALDICKLPAGSRIIDVGCGFGATLDYIERNGRYRLTGFDPSEHFLKETSRRLRGGQFVRGTGEALPFKNNSFDALLCECVLSVTSDKQIALTEFARVLTQDGRLIVSDAFFQKRPELRGYGAVSQDRGRLKGGLFMRDDLWGLLTDLGFSLVFWEEYDRLLKEFLARMIMAGEDLPGSWRCKPGQGDRKTDRPKISYFLLVAKKETSSVSSAINRRRQTR